MQKKIAGVYFHSGKTSQFIACVFDYFATGERWILEKLYFSGDSNIPSNENFEEWVKANNITDIVVNFPISNTICDNCDLECPGEEKCSNTTVVEMKKVISNLLEQDQFFELNNPKEYERARNKQDEYVHQQKVYSLDKINSLLTKSLKKRLRRGLIPYWNRPIDLYIWENYYDQLIQVFNFSYDSFGHTSLMNLKRFNYLKKHLAYVNIWEANIYLIFLELLKANYLSPEDLFGMKYVDEFSVSLRKSIVSKIEKNLNIYIKNEDSAVLTFDPRAINAFILSLAGISKVKNNSKQLPQWCLPINKNFIVPDFL